MCTELELIGKLCNRLERKGERHFEKAKAK